MLTPTTAKVSAYSCHVRLRKTVRIDYPAFPSYTGTFNPLPLATGVTVDYTTVNGNLECSQREDLVIEVNADYSLVGRVAVELPTSMQAASNNCMLGFQSGPVTGAVDISKCFIYTVAGTPNKYFVVADIAAKSVAYSGTQKLILRTTNLAMTNPACGGGFPLTIPGSSLVAWFYDAAANMPTDPSTGTNAIMKTTGSTGTGVTFVNTHGVSPLSYVYIPYKRYMDRMTMWHTSQSAPIEFDIVCPVNLVGTATLAVSPHKLEITLPATLLLSPAGTTTFTDDLTN